MSKFEEQDSGTCSYNDSDYSATFIHVYFLVVMPSYEPCRHSPITVHNMLNIAIVPYEVNYNAVFAYHNHVS